MERETKKGWAVSRARSFEQLASKSLAHRSVLIPTLVSRTLGAKMCDKVGVRRSTRWKPGGTEQL